MNRPLLLVSALALATSASAQKSPIEVPTNTARPPVVVQVDSIAMGALVTMLLRDIMRVPYVIAPDVLADRRATSVRLVIPRAQVAERVVEYLRNNGLSVWLSGGTVYVARERPKGGRISGGPATGQVLQNPAPYQPVQQPEVASYSPPGRNVPSGSPLSPGPMIERPSHDAERSEAPSMPSPASSEEVIAFVPAHRDPAYFASVISAILPEMRFGARAAAKGDLAAAEVRSTAGPDILVMSGSSADMIRARQLVALLDRPRQMIAVRAVVTQLSDRKSRGSALSILGRFLGGSQAVGSSAAPGSQFVRIASGSLTAILSAVREDSRFKVVATPNLAALSGETASMNSGSQVPTIGSVTTVDGGSPVQSVVYRDSGITLAVRPTVRGGLIELAVTEERSTFVPTTTGVEDSPTLQKSSVTASVVLKSGESVALAGLTEKSDDVRREGFFGGLLGTRSNDNVNSELFVILTAEIVTAPEAEPGVFYAIGFNEGGKVDG